MEKNANRSKRSLTNDSIIVLNDTGPKVGPTPKRFITFNTPLHTSTPVVSRTTKLLGIQSVGSPRSGGILQENGIMLGFPTIDPIEIDENSNARKEHPEAKQIQNQVKIVLEKMTPEYIRRMMNNVNDVGVLQAPPPTVHKGVSQIDFKSWRWQPHLKLKRFTKKDLNGLQVKQCESPKGKMFIPKKHDEHHLAKPITFDREESFIREISPERAAKTFRKRINVIKDSLRPAPMAAHDVNRKRSRVKKPLKEYYKEYEETHKRVQKTREKQVEKSFGRKLYNHGESYEGIDEKENSD